MLLFRCAVMVCIGAPLNRVAPASAEAQHAPPLTEFLSGLAQGGAETTIFQVQRKHLERVIHVSESRDFQPPSGDVLETVFAVDEVVNAHRARIAEKRRDRKSVESGKSVSVRGEHG